MGDCGRGLDHRSTIVGSGSFLSVSLVVFILILVRSGLIRVSSVITIHPDSSRFIPIHHEYSTTVLQLYHGATVVAL